MSIDNNFENQRIIISTADYYDDNIVFSIDSIKNNKAPSKLALRWTHNNKVYRYDSRTFCTSI